MISPRHQAALDYAAAGLPVFPCVVDGKAPACEGGFRAATTDVDQINRWWSQADYNPAICPEDCGWLVVDIEANGLPIWQSDAREQPETYTVETPRGGWHLYFKGSGRSTVQTLMPHVDTRGQGGYVLIPPSVVAGKAYRVLSDREPAWLPEWVGVALVARADAVDADEVELDLPTNVDRAMRYLARDLAENGPPVEGAGSDDRAYRAAAGIADLALSAEKRCELLAAWAPDFDPDWIAAKVANADEYRQNEGHRDAAPNLASLPAVHELLSAQSAEPVKRSKFYPLNENEQDAQKDPKWLIPELFQEQGTAMIIGKSGSFKTFVAVDVALSIACGVATFGHVPSVRGAVIYAAAEGARGLKLRRQAWKMARQVDAAPLFFVTAPPLIALPEEVQEFGDAITARVQGGPVAAIVIDTQSKAMAGLNENDVKDANRMVLFAESLAQAFHCLVILIHHQGKTEDKEGYGRGSSAFYAGYDTVLEITRPERAVPAIECRIRKQKDGIEREEPWFFEGQALGQSLILVPIDRRDYLKMTRGEDQFDLKKIGAVLANHGAYGQEKGLTTRVLATDLEPHLENEGPERYAEKLARAEKTLRRLASGGLRAYTESEGGKLVWCLPAKVS